jgi:hypothetical protein
MTIKTNNPLFQIDDFFNRLARAKYYSCNDLKLEYYQIRIVDGNIEKTT